ASTVVGAHGYFDFDGASRYYGWTYCGSLDEMTSVLSHETVEMVTNPTGEEWYAEQSGYELSDLCAWLAPHDHDVRVNGVLASRYCAASGQRCVPEGSEA